MPGMLVVFSNLGIDQALIYHIGQGKIDRNKIFGTVIFFAAVISILALGAYFLLLPYLSATILKNIDLNILKLSFILVPSIVIDTLVLSAFKGFRKFNISNGLSLFKRGLLLFGVFAAIIIFKTGVKGAITGCVVVRLISTFVFICVLFYSSARSMSLYWKRLKPFMAYGIATHIGSVLAKLEYRFDIFILNFFLDIAHVGIYSVSIAMTQLLLYISHSINTVLFPEISSVSQAKAVQFTPRICRNAFFICGIAGLFLVLVGYHLIRFFYGAEFTLAYPVLLILLPGVMMDVIFRILRTYFKGTGRPFLVSKVLAITSCLNLLLNLALIPLWGILGAATSSLISYSLSAFILLGYFCKENKVGLSEFLLLRRSDFAYYSALAARIRKKVKMPFIDGDADFENT